MYFDVSKTPLTEFSVKFMQGMLYRMGMSHFKYGKVADAFPDKVNALDSLMLRLKKYRETHNTEYLIDAANFAMIEFMFPQFPDAKFDAESKSPGRIWHDYKQPTEKDNKDE